MSNVYIFYMILTYILLSLLTWTNANAATAQNGVIPSSFKEGYYSMGFETTYLTTSANYTDRGTSLDFDPDYAYSAYQSAIYGRYDFSNQLSGFTQLPLNYAMSENTTDSRASFKIPGLSIGVNYDFKFYNVNVIYEMSGYYALETFDRSSDDVLTSNGTSYFDVGSHFFKDLSIFQLHGYLSFAYRLDGFSSLLNYQTDISYKSQKSTVTVGLSGFQSVIDDLNSNNPSARHAYLSSVNGSSLIYGSVNPSRLDLFAQTKQTLGESIDIYGTIGKSIRGENSGDILTFTVGLEYFFEPLLSKKNKYQYLPKEDDFVADDEKVVLPIKPKKKVYQKPAPQPIKKPVAKPKTKKFDLVISKKHLGKKTTSTSPTKPKPKSKKPTRVRIDF